MNTREKGGCIYRSVRTKPANKFVRFVSENCPFFVRVMCYNNYNRIIVFTKSPKRRALFVVQSSGVHRLVPYKPPRWRLAIIIEVRVGLNTTRSCQGWEVVVFERVGEIFLQIQSMAGLPRCFYYIQTWVVRAL